MSENQKQVELLSAEEQDAIGKALYLLTLGCPAIPSGVNVRYGDISGNTIGIFPQKGAVITVHYIDGGFKAQFPFLLLYRSKPTTDNDRIAREETLGNIARWMSGRKITVNNMEYALSEYPQLSDGRKIIEIEQLQTAYLAGKLEDGNVDFSVNMRLDYKKREEG